MRKNIENVKGKMIYVYIHGKNEEMPVDVNIFEKKDIMFPFVIESIKKYLTLKEVNSNDLMLKCFDFKIKFLREKSIYTYGFSVKNNEINEEILYVNEKKCELTEFITEKGRVLSIALTNGKIKSRKHLENIRNFIINI